ncbi:MAG: DUF2691 family protein [Bacillota bacterium]
MRSFPRRISFELPNDFGSFLKDNGAILKGSELQAVIEKEKAYLVFMELRAFQGDVILHPDTYEEFAANDCQLVLLIADSIYTTIYCKDQLMLHSL